MSTGLKIDTFSYTFPVIRGIQSGHEYFVTMVPMKIVPSLFLFNNESLPPQMRAQRLLNKSRIPSITKYLLENPNTYTFSSLTASIDRIVKFIPIPENDQNSKIGYITIPADTRIIINDGQHRRAAITEAIKQKPELAYETISVVFYIDTGLNRSQQMFADLNRHAAKPSGSLNILYDHKDSFAKLVLDFIEDIPIFKNTVDFEKTSISNRSSKLFTLNSVYRANKALLDSNTLSEKEIQLTAIEFWNEVTIHMKPWQEYLHGKPAYILRNETIAVHDLSLQAIAIIGSTLFKDDQVEWRKKLETMNKINWSRENKEWDQRALFSGKLRKSYTNVVLTANLIKKKLGIQLNPKEQEYEKRVIR